MPLRETLFRSGHSGREVDGLNHGTARAEKSPASCSSWPVVQAPALQDPRFSPFGRGSSGFFAHNSGVSRAAEPGQGGVVRLHNAYPASSIHTAFVPVCLLLGGALLSTPCPPEKTPQSSHLTRDNRAVCGDTNWALFGRAAVAVRPGHPCMLRHHRGTHPP